MRLSRVKRRGLIQIRQERQKRLIGPDPLILHAVIDENALRRRVGSASVMAAQLDHLVELSSYLNITLKVVSASHGVYPGCESAGFTLLEFQEREQRRDNICLVEGLVGSLWVERAADRQRVARMFEYLERLAYSPEQSRDFIMAAAREYT